MDTKYKAPVGSSLVPQHCNMQALTLELPSEDTNLQDKQPSFCFHINGCGQPSTLTDPVGLSLQICLPIALQVFTTRGMDAVTSYSAISCTDIWAIHLCS